MSDTLRQRADSLVVTVFKDRREYWIDVALMADLQAAIHAALEQVVEDCAKVAATQKFAGRSAYFTDEPGYKRACDDCANAIRQQEAR